MNKFSLVSWIRHEPLKKLAQTLLALSIICFPFQIRTLLYTPDIFYGGNFNPFTAVFLSLSNLLVVGAGFLYGAFLLKKRKTEMTFLWDDTDNETLPMPPVESDANYNYGWFWLSFFIVMVLVGFVSTSLPTVHWYNFFHWSIILVWFLLLCSDLLPWKIKFYCFLAVMGFEAVVGFLQYGFQTSIGLGKLGEPIMNAAVPGIAKIDWQGMKLIRPYGTFPHTNVLAGAMVFALFISMYTFQKHIWKIIVATLFFGTALVFTFSRSAWLGFLVALVLTFLLVKVKHKLAIVLSIFLIAGGIFFTQIQGPLVSRIFGSDGQSTAERELYLEISKEMFFKNPMGVGLGSFTHLMSDYTDQKLAPWVLQPVHNVYLLILNELGVLGLGIFGALLLYLVWRIWKQRSQDNKKAVSKNFSRTFLGGSLFITFLVIGLFDHYFFTLEQGQFLFIFMLAFIGYTAKKDLLPRIKS